MVNDAQPDARIYVLAGGTTRFRVGTVTGLGRDTFRIPHSHRLVFYVDFIGGHRGWVVEAFPTMGEWACVELRINPLVSTSYVMACS